MRVRMLTSVAGSMSYDVGQVVSLDLSLAHAWIGAGLAELVREEPDVEAAIVTPPEHTMRDRPRRRDRPRKGGEVA
jgi:hypothetical protein